jgi:Tfp pilus assembly protein PilO
MGRHSKVLAIVLAVAVAGFLGDQLFLSPWLDTMKKRDADIARVQAEIARHKAVLAREKAVRQEWERLSALLTRKREPSIEAHFMTHLGDLCKKAGVSYDRIQNDRVVQQGVFKEYPYQTKFKLSWSELVRLLVALHNSPELLKPARVTITSLYEREPRIDLDLKVSTLEYEPLAAKNGTK